jgi:hypothetical protein
MQVFFLAVLIHAVHAALENRVVAFDGVRDDFACGVFTLSVIDRKWQINSPFTMIASAARCA